MIREIIEKITSWVVRIDVGATPPRPLELTLTVPNRSSLTGPCGALLPVRSERSRFDFALPVSAIGCKRRSLRLRPLADLVFFPKIRIELRGDASQSERHEQPTAASAQQNRSASDLKEGGTVLCTDPRRKIDLAKPMSAQGAAGAPAPTSISTILALIQNNKVLPCL